MKNRNRQIMAFALAAVLLAGCGPKQDAQVKPEPEPEPQVTIDEPEEEEPVAEEGEVLRIFAPDTALKERLEAYWDQVDAGATEEAADSGDTVLKDGTHISWEISGLPSDRYCDRLNSLLTDKRPEEADDRIDMYVVSSDDVRSFFDDELSLNLWEGVEFDEELLDRFYGVTQLGTDSDEVLRALAWDADPGVFLYRRSIAKEVMGEDDPDSIIEAMWSVESMAKLAEKAAGAGYRFLSACDDTYPMYEAYMDYSWQDGSEIHVDESLMNWVSDTREYTDRGWNNKTRHGNKKWREDILSDDAVFGVFTTAAEIKSIFADDDLEEDSEEEIKDGDDSEAKALSDFAICTPPYRYEGPVQMLLTSPESDNMKLVAEIYTGFVCDSDTLTSITKDERFGEFTNTMSGMLALGEDEEMEFLGGVNPFTTFEAIMEESTAGARSPIDSVCREAFKDAMQGYFEGKVSLDGAKANFESTVTEELPDVTGVSWP